MKQEVRLITAALPYVNNTPHLGNIVGSHLPADIFARYNRLIGHRVAFIGGTDEHGTATEIAAQKNGVTPKQLCDFFYTVHKEIYDWFQFSYDNFSRTSSPLHHKTVQEFFTVLFKKDYLVEGNLQLPFCDSCKRQLSDRFIEGTCPKCNYTKARGDQCEQCGEILDPINLLDPRCSICTSTKIIFKETKHLFLDLEKLSKSLHTWILKQKHWRSAVRNMALAWISTGLKKRCITRNLDWGIKVPFKGFEHLVFYVWAEAAIGYISATKEWNEKSWKLFWQDKKSKIYHFIGKDNIPFHTILFPGELIAHGEYTLPYNVVGLQYLNFEGGKFSKSGERGVFCEHLPGSSLSSDYWRFYLTYLIPETKDSDFSWKDFQERVNKDLIGNFSNFINRTLKFISTKFDKRIPSGKKDPVFVEQVKKITAEVLEAYEKVEIRLALQTLLKLSDYGNQYFDKKKPWETNDKDTLFLCANLCHTLALLMQPILPETSSKIFKMLRASEKDTEFQKINSFFLKDSQILEPEILFKKIEEKDIIALKTSTSKATDFSEKIKR